ncbi:hypothetical protein V6B33_18570 [Mangrovibacillus sp. Mu-81]|jgi:hypothetical protein
MDNHKKDSFKIQNKHRLKLIETTKLVSHYDVVIIAIIFLSIIILKWMD